MEARKIRAAVRRRATVLGARSARMVGVRAYTPGLLSIVVPAYGVEKYIGECLDSLRAQDYRHVEIIVVDDESRDRSREIALAHAAEDRRVRVVSRPNGGLSAARNTGVEAAVGQYLTFVDADDTVAPGAYAPAIETLKSSESDFAVLFYRRRRGTVVDAPGSWIRVTHAEPHIGVDLDSYPEAMVNAVAWGKVYRRRFYDEAGLRFPEGLLYEDQAVSMRAFARARAFDVLPQVGVEWRIRNDGTSISQQDKEVGNIAAHTRAMEDSIAELTAMGKERPAQIRALQLLDNNMQFFKLNAVHRDPVYWAELRRAITFLVELVPRPEYLREVGAHKKVLGELIMADRMEDAASFQENRDPSVSRYPTRREGAQVYVDLGPGLEDIDPEMFRLSRAESAVRARVLGARWADEHLLRLEGGAYLDRVDLSDGPPLTRIVAHSPGDERVELDVVVRQNWRVELGSALDYADVSNGGFVAELDTRKLPDTEQRWRLDATVSSGELTGTGSLTFQPWVEAAIRRPVVDKPGRSVAVERNRAGLFYVTVRTSPTHVLEGRLDGDVLEIDLGGQRPSRVYLSGADVGHPVLAGALRHSGERVTVRFDLRRLRRGTDPDPCYQLVAVGRHGGAVPVIDAPTSPEAGPLQEFAIGRSPGGALEVRHRRYDVRVEKLEVVGTEGAEELVATVTTYACDGTPGVPILFSPGRDVVGTAEVVGDGRLRLRYPLTRTVWGVAGLLVPRAQYHIGMRFGDQLVIGHATPGLAETLPWEAGHPRLRTLLEIFEPARPGVRLEIGAPLRNDERTRRGQQLLRTRCRRAVAERRSVFFRALYGEVANGNGLGVHQELLRRGSELELNWSIQDYSVAVPEGATPVIERTREWHESMAQSRYQMVDVHQLDWFERPQGQDLIQTMHGYPYKVMGHDWWRKGSFPVRQVATFDRRAREWTYFVSPASYATPLLKEAFLDPAGSRPKVLEIGYPRNDAFLRPESTQQRARARELLGLHEGQVVVLYGPTFRDYLSVDDTTATRVSFFDPHTASAALPDHYVLLMRGHAFNARVATEREASTGRVIDVTDYPDINDLILASDAAVLDYSSLRFDYVLSGNPMVFLVPDLEVYDAARGGVIPYGPTAPGPQVNTTEEVVEQLRDIEGLSLRWAQARQRFREEYVDLEDGHAAERLVDAVFVPRGDAPVPPARPRV